MDKFLSCDWGTSSFRIRLVSLPGLNVLAEEKSGEGIASTFNLWKESNSVEENKLAFYLSVLNDKIKSLEQQLQTRLENIPVIISGMASSTIGMIDLPYKHLPVHADGSDLVTKKFDKADNFPHDILIISGIRTENDVIRGEETQLAGCSLMEDGLFIFPGTHSKHIMVKDGIAVDFKTYMTGEFFELLASKSILASSVDKATATDQLLQAFDKGVNNAGLNLLHASFLVRTNQLFDKYSKEKNYYYLSGLLIGSELKDLKSASHSNIFLVGTEELCFYYEKALQILEPEKTIKTINAEEATIKGQYKIFAPHPRSFSRKPGEGGKERPT
jgi:2-dehydro-3-deoxygalactonokinase